MHSCDVVTYRKHTQSPILYKQRHPTANDWPPECDQLNHRLTVALQTGTKHWPSHSCTQHIPDRPHYIHSILEQCRYNCTRVFKSCAIAKQLLAAITSESYDYTRHYCLCSVPISCRWEFLPSTNEVCAPVDILTAGAESGAPWCDHRRLMVANTHIKLNLHV